MNARLETAPVLASRAGRASAASLERALMENGVGSAIRTANVNPLPLICKYSFERYIEVI